MSFAMTQVPQLALLVLACLYTETFAESGPCETMPACKCSPAGGPPENVVIMDCRNKMLTAVPDLSDYVKLNGLFLDDNSIATVADDAFVGPTQLKHLYVTKNLLSVFPAAAVKNLSSLNTISFNSNPFTTPHVDVDTFDKMSSLTNAFLSSRFNVENDGPGGDDAFNRGLNFTFRHFRSTTQLRVLDLDGNHIACRHVLAWGEYEASHFAPLRRVSFQACQLNKLPPFVKMLPLVYDIRLSFNKITTIDAASLPPKVERLDIAGNMLTELTSQSIPPTVTKLAIFANFIRGIDFGVFDAMQNLTSLAMTAADKQLSSCEMIDAKVVCSCGTGTAPSASGNACTHCHQHVPGFPDVTCSSGLAGASCHTYCGAFFLSSPGDNISRSDASARYTCTADGQWELGSEALNCSDTVCSDPRSPCTCRPSTDPAGTVVDCSRTGIGSIPGMLPNDTVQLDLANNSISYVPSAALSYLTRLKLVDLSHNAITALGDGALAAPLLTHIDLSNNSITGLEHSPFTTEFRLSSLDLRDNSITFVESTAVLTRSFHDVHTSFKEDGYDTGLLKMQGNPLECAYISRKPHTQERLHVECDCQRLGSTRLPFCPRDPTEFTFTCAESDSRVAIATSQVCDGIEHCLPSGRDEDVCTGVVRAVDYDNVICRFRSSHLIEACPNPEVVESCFDRSLLNVSHGIVKMESDIGCGATLCDPGIGLMTGVGTWTGGGDGLSIDAGSARHWTVYARLQGDNDSPFPSSSVSCVISIEAIVGNPLGIDYIPVEKPPTTTSARRETTPLPTVTSAPATSRSTTVPSNVRDGSGALPMSQQQAVVGVVCATLVCILFVVSVLLWHARQKQRRQLLQVTGGDF